MYAKETEKAPSSNLSSDMLTREALLVAEINNRLRSKLKVCQEYETSIAFLQEKIKVKLIYLKKIFFVSVVLNSLGLRIDD